jgi:hypothetical protein
MLDRLKGNEYLHLQLSCVGQLSLAHARQESVCRQNFCIKLLGPLKSQTGQQALSAHVHSTLSILVFVFQDRDVMIKLKRARLRLLQICERNTRCMSITLILPTCARYKLRFHCFCCSPLKGITSVMMKVILSAKTAMS